MGLPEITRVMGIWVKANMATMVMVIIRVIYNLILAATMTIGTGVVITAAAMLEVIMAGAAMVGIDNIATTIDLSLAFITAIMGNRDAIKMARMDVRYLARFFTLRYGRIS
jgi:hypothetical protein